MPTSPPILFLDFDGVLNCQGGSSHQGGREEFTPAAVLALRSILDKSECKIVISSSWREDLMARIPAVFTKNGLGDYVPRIIGRTPQIPDAPQHTRRGDEIGKWLDDHPQFRERFVIVDDDWIPLELAPFHVRTNLEVGLTRANAQKALMILAVLRAKKTRSGKRSRTSSAENIG